MGGKQDGQPRASTDYRQYYQALLITEYVQKASLTHQWHELIKTDQKYCHLNITSAC